MRVYCMLERYIFTLKFPLLIWCFHVHSSAGDDDYDIAYDEQPVENFGDVYGNVNDDLELQVVENPYYDQEVETSQGNIRIPSTNTNDVEMITSRQNDYYEM